MLSLRLNVGQFICIPAISMKRQVRAIHMEATFHHRSSRVDLTGLQIVKHTPSSTRQPEASVQKRPSRGHLNWLTRKILNKTHNIRLDAACGISRLQYVEVAGPLQVRQGRRLFWRRRLCCDATVPEANYRSPLVAWPLFAIPVRLALVGSGWTCSVASRMEAPSRRWLGSLLTITRVGGTLGAL